MASVRAARPSSTLSIAVIVLTMALAGLAGAPAGAVTGSDMPAASYDDDPRSGAALNAEWARGQVTNPGGEAGPTFIRRHSVNDPAADSTAQDTQSETTIAVDGDNVVVGWNDSGSFIGGDSHFTGYASSADRGVTFIDHGSLPDSAEGDAGDPVVAVDNTSGAFYLSTLGFTTFENLQVFKSTDGGTSFGAPVNGTPGYAGSGAFQDKEWLAVDNATGSGQGNVYLCWTRFVGNTGQIRFTRSTDGGSTFGPSQGALLSAGGQGCYVAVGPDHSVYVFFYRGSGTGGQGGDNKLWVRKSTDAGVTFSPDVQVADLLTTSINGNLALNGGLRSNSFIHAAVNPVSGDLYAVFNDDPAGADGADTYLVSSDDGAATWSSPAQLNDDDGGRDQFFPTVAVMGSGTEMMVGYYSRSHDAGNLAFHRRGRTASITATGDLQWRESFQMGPDTPIVIGQDPVINPTYMGDYDQIAAGDDHFYSSFSDNRDSNAFHANQPDVFFARISAAPLTTNVQLEVTAPATGIVGVPFTIRITATNTGSAIARDVYVNDVLPAGFTLVRARRPGGGCDPFGRLVSCHLRSLDAGESSTTRVRVVATQVGTFADAAEVTTSSVDTTGGDDTDSASVTITGAGAASGR